MKQTGSEKQGSKNKPYLTIELVLPGKPPKQEKFRIAEHMELEEHKLPKFEWHLILKHASPDSVIILARNSTVNILSLNTTSKSKMDVTCHGCMEGKIQRAPQKRATHSYRRGEAVSADIMGSLNIKEMTVSFQRYLLSLIDLKTRYKYV